VTMQVPFKKNLRKALEGTKTAVVKIQNCIN